MKETNDFLVLIVAESGAGKTTVVNELQRRYGYNVIESFTTRSERYRGEKGHIFVDKLVYDKHKELGIIIAETDYMGNKYWAVKTQIEGTTLYIIDPDGVDSMKELCPDIPQLVIYLKVDESERIIRLLDRDKNHEVVHDRIVNDRKAFKIVKCDYVIDATNRSVNSVVDLVQSVLEMEV